MRILANPASLLAALALLGACAQGEDAIDSDGKVFDAIASDAEIELTGTEPFWNLTITPEPGGGYTALYSEPENIDGTRFATTRFAGNNGLGFSGELDGRPVQIAITPGECSDGMSDRVFPYTASVRLGEELLLGCGYTSDEPFTGPRQP